MRLWRKKPTVQPLPDVGLDDVIKAGHDRARAAGIDGLGGNARPSPTLRRALEKTPGDGLKKFDHGKPRLDLLPAGALEDVAAVMAAGAAKYDDNNWRKGTAWSRYYAAALRHIFAWWRGEDRDPETGLSHLAHAICCLLFLLEYVRGGQRYEQHDDRYKTEVQHASH